ncbi:MAG: type II toxin-antitoxin system HipA family toxin [Rhizomicrobium sp.]|nr:type II toxin-antitoxin system HipA family toxin [Rhizomicrobium sp.]
MARRRKSGRLNVFLNGRQIGTLNREASEAIDFVYVPDWLAWNNALPVSLSLPLREDRYIGAPVSAVFDNLLPDNLDIRRKVAERIGAGGVDAFSLLEAVGRDCVGALQFLPEDHAPEAVGTIKGHNVSEEEIAKRLANLARAPLGLNSDDDFRISIAGAQEKTALLRYKGRWQLPIGSTPTTHILKPQIGKIPNGIDLSNSVENEYFCLILAKALGLPSAHVEMVSFGGKKVLVIERFDRLFTRNGRLLRVPQEDFCQALSVPWTTKYEKDGGPGIPQILRLLAGSDEAYSDRKNFLKSMIFFWLIGATDGHAKNFSLFLEPGGGYRMTPLYDIVTAQPSFAANQIRRNQMKLAMAVGDKRHYTVESVSGRHFIQSAAKADVGRSVVLEAIDDLLNVGRSAVDRIVSELPKDFPSFIVETTSKAFKDRLDYLKRERESLK